MRIPRMSLNHLTNCENIHMSNKFLTKNHLNFNYFNAPSIRKPRGFWYSINIEWLNWVKSEMPDWEFPFLYELILDKTKILSIHNENDLKEFFNKYISKKQIELSIGDFYYRTNWYKLSKDYSGIEFLNYKKSYNMNIDISPFEFKKIVWYDHIDVSSGCIWNINALISINLIDE